MTTTASDKETTVPTSVRLPKDLSDLLAVMAKDDDRPIASMLVVAVRRGVAVLLRDTERFPAAAQFAGLGSGPPPPPVPSVPGEGPPAS